MHYYEPCACVCTSVWGKLCRSRGLDNWLVLECQMAEEGIMADSSCCHGGGGGGCEGLKWRGPMAFCEWAPRLSWPPPSSLIQACRALLWWGDGNPGTWQQAGDLLAPLSCCLSSPSLSLSWPSSFIFSSCSLSLPLSPPHLPCLACFVPCLIFQCIYFILRPLSLSVKSCKNGNSPTSFKRVKHRSGRKSETKRMGGGKEELEFSYGIAKETAERKEKIGFQ